MSPWLPLTLAFAYVAFLFWIAAKAERHGDAPALQRCWPAITVLSLAIYCTSWTFFGGVGTATREGWPYLAIYLGPALVFLFGRGFLERLVETAKRENATSIADFIANRYGKSRGVAGLVASLALLGALPYIALQIKSVGQSFAALTNGGAVQGGVVQGDAAHGPALVFAALLAVFAIMFGARRFDAAGRNRGLVVAVAVESAVKLAAFLALGLFALLALPALDPAARAAGAAKLGALFSPAKLDFDFLTITLLAAGAIVLLPRQFHIAVVEARDPRHVSAAGPAFVAYLAVTSLIVLPVALAGLAVLPTSAPPDLYVLGLPLALGAEGLALLVFIGGFSAATSMVIVETVALATMVSNDLLAPLLLRSRALGGAADMGRLLLFARRATIIAIVLAAYLFYRGVGSSEALASIGLVAFAAVIQFAPALIAGLYWPRATTDGARAGLIAGLALWAWTLLLPSYLGERGLAALGVDAAFGGLVHPRALLGLAGLDPLTHGVLWSLGLNIALTVGVSLAQRERFGALPTRIARWRAPRFGHAASLGDLKTLAQRFVGQAVADDEFAQAAFERGRSFHPADPIDGEAARLAERLVAGVIGAPSARVIVASALSGAALDVEEVVRLLDETSQELNFSRELLGVTLDHISQGVSVVDKDLRLIAWNSRYLEMFDFPPGFIRVGRPIAEVIRYNAERGECGPGEVDEHVARRLANYRRGLPHAFERERPGGMVLKTLGNPMPGGGYVTTFTDISAEKRAQAALEEANEQLEERVARRTAELSREAEINRRLAAELHRAKRAAEDATASKTRFLAAASHDLLQPLHAARLFAAALEADLADADPAARIMAGNVDRAIASADRLLRALLDITRLDAGGVTPRFTVFPLAALFDELATEFRPLAAEKGLRLAVAPTSLWVRADRTLLRSILQNFLSNAVRYTRRGGVLFGARRDGASARLEVWDTGPGVPEDKRRAIFEEFRRLEPGQGGDGGVGLGLAIVERTARLLGAPLTLKSVVGRGSMFAVGLPVAAPAAAPARDDAADAAVAGLSVLCVDNDEAILLAMVETLRRWGCRPTAAASFEQALCAIAEGRFDAALIDHQLDGPETGLDVIAALRGAHGDARMVLVTANPDPELIAAAKALGAATLRKPAAARDLRAALAAEPARV